MRCFNCLPMSIELDLSDGIQDVAAGCGRSGICLGICDGNIAVAADTAATNTQIRCYSL